MTDRYCVFGNPISHSKSPRIHALFAELTAEDMAYEARLAPVDGFTEAVRQFMAEGGRGANVTLPFKEEAFRLCDRLTPRAGQAGAVNTLVFNEHGITGDNTDGAGLVQDLTRHLGVCLKASRLLLLGAGGAARGALGPLLAENPAQVVIANRTLSRAEALARHFATPGIQVNALDYGALTGQTFDVVINATSASLGGEALPVSATLYAPGAVAYDMMYGKGDTPFLAAAREAGVTRLTDGLGMLVAQAAEAFFVWRHIRPPCEPVLKVLRQS